MEYAERIEITFKSGETISYGKGEWDGSVSGLLTFRAFCDIFIISKTIMRYD